MRKAREEFSDRIDVIGGITRLRPEPAKRILDWDGVVPLLRFRLMEMGSKIWRRILIGALVLVASVLLLVIGGIGWIAYSIQIPSDSELVAFFGERKPALIALRDLLLEEPPRIVGFTRTEVMVEETWKWFSPGDAGMSLDRFERIQKLMASNSVEQVWRNENEFAVVAGYAGGGFLNKGPRLAYVYRNDSPSVQVESLDPPIKVKRKPYGSGSTVIHRPLGEGWFIRLIP